MLRMLTIPKIHYRWWMFLLAFLLGLLIQESIFAQSSSHRLTNGNLPPGKATEIALRSNPKFFGYVQPVKILTPGDARVEFWTGAGYAKADFQGPTFGMTMGPVYRIKITNIPNEPGKEIYPSIELLSRLHPPQGKELEFPIPIEFTQDDLEQAIRGKMVTKVVYLEDPDTALPFRQGPNQRTTDISEYEDTMSTANRLGRPMALVRLGSRQPLADDQMGAFEFHGPALQIMEGVEALPAIDANPSNNIIPESLPGQSTHMRNGAPFAPIPNATGFQKTNYSMSDK